jgi:hypothetical protein
MYDIKVYEMVNGVKTERETIRNVTYGQYFYISQAFDRAGVIYKAFHENTQSEAVHLNPA